ncbi:hypothetical protein GWK47_033749 [Chionoecetes opilio]|uniref:Uncharacterized protein n=1 Tax=Chionoecetes opilio TaxID=41210 RepID=A0A8J4YPI6_CHIOP|nr:hypothetical protein GWK47_033749 [Chionoecetes opilio]
MVEGGTKTSAFVTLHRRGHCPRGAKVLGDREDPNDDGKSAVRKVEVLFKDWKALVKSKGRATNKTKEEEFHEALCDLFDVAHADAMTLKTIPADCEFLAAQREKGHRGIMQGADRVLERRVQRREMTVAAEKRSREASTSQLDERAVLTSSSSSSSVESSPARGEAAATTEPTGASPPKRRARGSQVVLSQELASALDRTGVSDRNVLRILAAEVKTTFVPDTPLTVHWDGKILPDCDCMRVDRLAILVSGDGVQKLIGIPKLACETGEAMASAVAEALDD